MILQKLHEHKVIAILRGIPSAAVADTAEALYAGGVRLLEITFDQKNLARLPETMAAIEVAHATMGGRMEIGAGTVLTVREVEAAYQVGASFILSPNTDQAVIDRTKELGMSAIPGAFTPSEMVDAYRYGADVVKLFPAGELGVGYLKAVTAPLSHIPLLAVGGITPQNMQAFLTMTVGVGIGSNLVNPTLIAQRRFDKITALAKEYTNQWNKGE